MVAAAASAVAVTAGGCGASNAVRQAVDPVASAAEITAHTPGYRIDGVTVVTTPTASVQGTMSGMMSTAQRTGALTMRMTVAGHTMSMAERFAGTVVYMKAGDEPALQRLTGGRPWLRFDLDRTMGAMGLGGLPTQGSTNPAQFLDYLRAVGARERRVGTQTVGGVSTTHYSVTIDLDRYARLFPPARRAAAARGIATLESVTGSHTLPMDVWIDSHRLVRRLSFAMNECIQNEHMTMRMAMNLSHYGEQPVPQMPPAAQTYDITPLLSKAMKSVKLACGSAA